MYISSFARLPLFWTLRTIKQSDKLSGNPKQPVCYQPAHKRWCWLHQRHLDPILTCPKKHQQKYKINQIHIFNYLASSLKPPNYLFKKKEREKRQETSNMARVEPHQNRIGVETIQKCVDRFVFWRVRPRTGAGPVRVVLLCIMWSYKWTQTPDNQIPGRHGGTKVFPSEETPPKACSSAEREIEKTTKWCPRCQTNQAKLTKVNLG